MVLGFNHNIRYRGELFHVQTEDSGRANPHIVTLLYRGGTIIASAKTSYADIIKADQLELVVESIMKDQHKEMMRRLKGGEFDARIFGQAVTDPAQAATAAPVQAPAPTAPTAQAPTAQAPTAQAPTAPAPMHTAPASAAQAPAQGAPPAQQAPPVRPVQQSQPAATASPVVPQAPTAFRTPPPEPPATPTKRSLDEVILDYLITGEEK